MDHSSQERIQLMEQVNGTGVWNSMDYKVYLVMFESATTSRSTYLVLILSEEAARSNLDHRRQNYQWLKLQHNISREDI